MKRATLILCVCVLCPIWSFASHSPEKIRTKDFSVYVRNGDRGLQFKMGMEKEVSNSPDWYSYRLGKNRAGRDKYRGFRCPENRAHHWKWCTKVILQPHPQTFAIERFHLFFRIWENRYGHAVCNAGKYRKPPYSPRKHIVDSRRISRRLLWIHVHELILVEWKKVAYVPIVERAFLYTLKMRTLL